MSLACSVRPYVTLFIHSFLAYIYNLFQAGHAQGKTQPKVVVFRVYKILKVATIYATCYPTRYLDFSPLPYRPEPYPMSKSPTRHSLVPNCIAQQHSHDAFFCCKSFKCERAKYFLPLSRFLLNSIQR